MKIQKTNQQGFAHHVFILGALVVVTMGGVFSLVIKAHNKATTNRTASGSTAHSASTLNSKQSSESQASAANPNNPSGGSGTSKTTNTSTTSGSSSTAKSSSSTSNTAPVTSSSQTPLNVLISLLSSAKTGSQITVTAADVDVPAAVFGTVKGRPIVFSVNGVTYWAYTRVNPPNFGNSADTIANSMAIVQANGAGSTVQAHLDKGNNLVDPNFALVGYTPSNS